MVRKRLFLDYAAGAGGNPSSPHTEGRQAKDRLETARQTIARLVEAKPDDVIFTSGATEANALAILGLVRAYKSAGVFNPHVLYLPSAHASVVENLQLLTHEGVSIEKLPIKDTQVDLAALGLLIRPTTVLVAMDAVCGETGVVWNTRAVRQTLDMARPTSIQDSHIWLHVDASQAPATEKLSRAHFGADLLTLDPSKLGATHRSGCLIVHRTIPMNPLYRGGGQERGLRSGTEDVESLAEFARSLSKAVKTRDAFRTTAEGQRRDLVTVLTSTIPNILINEGRTQAPHILNISLIGRDTDYLVALLDERGFAISTRSACETDSVEGSRAVAALFNDTERARATLRISWAPSVHSRELLRFARALATAVSFIDTTAKQ